MRKFVLFFIAVFSALSLKAQSGYTYYKFGAGINVSSVRPYADLAIARDNYAVSLSGYYNISPYIPLGLEFQLGRLAGGSIDTDPSKRQYENHYSAVVAHCDFQLGEIVDYDNSDIVYFLKDFYIGSGLGFINNNLASSTFVAGTASVQRTNLDGSTGYAIGTYTFPGKNKSINFMVPLRIGYEYKIFNQFDEPVVGISIGYTHNITWGEGLDGYNDPSLKFRNNSQDQYRQITIGLKVNLGTPATYIKTLH